VIALRAMGRGDLSNAEWERLRPLLPPTGRHYRAVATRYDKLKRRYQATLTIASILDWLRAKPDRPQS
jgi:transposase